MEDDEQAIHELIDTWLAASKAGDLPTVLSLMSDDVVFMMPGREPFGKETFAAASKDRTAQIEGSSDIVELKLLGDWAWIRNRLRIVITPPGGKPMVHSGYTLTILRKEPNGRWVLVRDANLLTPEAAAS